MQSFVPDNIALGRFLEHILHRCLVTTDALCTVGTADRAGMNIAEETAVVIMLFH